jgi:predicted RNA-binding Zn-ribbon protein involved in translation (DUF1610 family)
MYKPMYVCKMCGERFFGEPVEHANPMHFPCVSHPCSNGDKGRAELIGFRLYNEGDEELVQMYLKRDLVGFRCPECGKASALSINTAFNSSTRQFMCPKCEKGIVPIRYSNAVYVDSRG